MPFSFGVVFLSRAINLLLGESGYAVAVVDSTGRKPLLVGMVVVTPVVVVVEKDAVSVDVMVTAVLRVSVVRIVDVVENVSVTVLSVVVTVT